MEVLGYVSLTPLAVAYGPNGNLTSCAGGPLDFLQVIEGERTNHARLDPLRHVLALDTACRKTVYQQQTRDRGAFPTMSHALHEVLRNRTYMWGQAASEVALGVLQDGIASGLAVQT